jgi:hypothetical protein
VTASFYNLSNSLFIKYNSFRRDRNQLSLPEFESQTVKSIPTIISYKEGIMMIYLMINLSLYIIKLQGIKAYGGEKVWTQVFLTTA